MKITQAFDLKNYNTFGFAAESTAGALIFSKEDLHQAIAYAHEKKLSLIIIGGGSNIVLKNHLNALALIIKIPGMDLVREDEHHAWVRVGAGVEWDDLVAWSLSKGWYGLENLSIIPGTVGACPIQNVGAYGVEINDFFHELEALEVDGLQENIFSKEDCCFRYRDSIFKHQYRDKYIILSVTFRLNKTPKLNLNDRNLQKELSHLSADEITPLHLRNAVISVRNRRLPNVKLMGNAGSFFMNPSIDAALFHQIYEKYPDLVFTKIDENKYKISAAWMIDQCGWKGYQENHVGVFDVNALVLVNHGNATADHLLDLSKKIQQSVFENFGVVLSMEPRLYE